MLDTNVLSIEAPFAGQQQSNLQDWLRQNGARLYLPAISIAEITSGVEKLRRAGSLGRAAQLDAWIADTLQLYAPRILPLDAAAARFTGILLDRARALGLAPGFADLAIAGIAQAQGLTLLTRNLRHFAPLGIAASDPFAALPE